MHRQEGVALAIVVWFLAAMSLLVSGIVFQARADTRMAQLHAAKAKAVAAGDGAIQLMLANLASGNTQGLKEDYRLPAMGFLIGDYPVTVHLVPISGLIDLNNAPADVLALLFFAQGGQDEVGAKRLADGVLKWRSTAGRRSSQPSRFAAIEDLLRVEGVDRTVLDGIRDSVAVSKSGRGGLDWSSAPQSVLDVMAGKNPDKAASIRDGLARKQGSGNKKSRLGLNQSTRGLTAGSYRLDAIVQVGDQQWLRRRWASGGAAAGSQLPWRYTRTEAPRVFHDG